MAKKTKTVISRSVGGVITATPSAVAARAAATGTTTKTSAGSSSNVEVKYYKPDGTAVYGSVTEKIVIPSGTTAAKGANVSSGGSGGITAAQQAQINATTASQLQRIVALREKRGVDTTIEKAYVSDIKTVGIREASRRADISIAKTRRPVMPSSISSSATPTQKVDWASAEISKYKGAPVEKVGKTSGLFMYDYRNYGTVLEEMRTGQQYYLTQPVIEYRTAVAESKGKPIPKDIIGTVSDKEAIAARQYQYQKNVMSTTAEQLQTVEQKKLDILANKLVTTETSRADMFGSRAYKEYEYKLGLKTTEIQGLVSSGKLSYEAGISRLEAENKYLFGQYETSYKGYVSQINKGMSQKLEIAGIKSNTKISAELGQLSKDIGAITPSGQKTLELYSGGSLQRTVLKYIPPLNKQYLSMVSTSESLHKEARIAAQNKQGFKAWRLETESFKTGISAGILGNPQDIILAAPLGFVGGAGLTALSAAARTSKVAKISLGTIKYGGAGLWAAGAGTEFLTAKSTTSAGMVVGKNINVVAGLSLGAKGYNVYRTRAGMNKFYEAAIVDTKQYTINQKQTIETSRINAAIRQDGVTYKISGQTRGFVTEKSTKTYLDYNAKTSSFETKGGTFYSIKGESGFNVAEVLKGTKYKPFSSDVLKFKGTARQGKLGTNIGLNYLEQSSLKSGKTLYQSGRINTLIKSSPKLKAFEFLSVTKSGKTTTKAPKNFYMELVPEFKGKGTVQKANYGIIRPQKKVIPLTIQHKPSGMSVGYEDISIKKYKTGLISIGGKKALGSFGYEAGQKSIKLVSLKGMGTKGQQSLYLTEQKKGISDLRLTEETIKTKRPKSIFTSSILTGQAEKAWTKTLKLTETKPAITMLVGGTLKGLSLRAPRSEVLFKNRVLTLQKGSLMQANLLESKTTTITATATTLKQTLKTSTIQTNIVTTPEVTPTILVPIVPSVYIGGVDLGGGFRGSGGKSFLKMPTREFKYVASIRAGQFGIFGKQPKLLTGIETRPLLRGNR